MRVSAFFRSFLAILSMLAVCYGQLVFSGARQMSLGSDKIVWSDDRYVELYGRSTSFIVDLNTDYDRFRNYVNLSQSNVSLDGMFRARGRTYPKTIIPSCSYYNTNPEVKLQQEYLIDKKVTYFMVKNNNLTIATLDQGCRLQTDNFNQLIDSNMKKEMIKVGDKFLGIKIGTIFYIINTQIMVIAQKLDLSPCSHAANEDYKLNYIIGSKNQSWQFIISTTVRFCVYERLSVNGNFNFLKEIRMDFPEFSQFTLINSSVGFIMTQNCTQVRLDYANFKTQPVLSQVLFKDSIVGLNEYRSPYYNYDDVTFIILKNGDIYSLRSFVNFYTRIPIEEGTTMIKATINRQVQYDQIRCYYISSDWQLKQYRFNGGTTTVLNSVKDYNMTALDSIDLDDSVLSVFAAGVIDGKLVVAYINGFYDTLVSAVNSSLPDAQAQYQATDVRATYHYDTKQTAFYVIVKNVQTGLLNCYSYRVNTSTKKVEFLGFYPMNSNYFQFSGLTYGSEKGYIFWHEVVKGKNYIFRTNSQLEINRYYVGEDFKGFNVGTSQIRIMRTSGRSDFYTIQPLEKNRYGSFYTANFEQEVFAIFAPYSQNLYMETNSSSSVYVATPKTMFISRTMAIRPNNLCTNTVVPLIFSSPRDAYTIFISSNPGKLQQLVVYLTFYEPYGYYEDRISTIKLRYNDSLSFQMKSNRYSKESNTLYLELIPSVSPGKLMLAAVKLDYMEPIRDYVVWDWIYQFDGLQLQDYRISSDSVVVYAEGGKRITRFDTGGVSPTLPWFFDKGQLPYLVAKRAQIGIYLVNNNYDSLAINLVTGQELYRFNNTIFVSISPNGKYLMLKNKSEPTTVTIYKQTSLLGRIYLQTPLTNSSKIEFMSDTLIFFMDGSGSYRSLNIYKLSENPFQYKLYPYLYEGITKQPLYSYNESHVGFHSGTIITIFDRQLNIVQNLSTSPLGRDPESISVGEGSNVYAKFNNMLYIWKVGTCPDGKKNKDGICSDGGGDDDGPSGGAIAGIVVGVVGGVALASVGGFFLFKKLRARTTKDNPLLQEDNNNEQVITGTYQQSVGNKNTEDID